MQVGWQVNSGGRLSSCAGEESPCRRAYQLYVGEGEPHHVGASTPGEARPSWDPLTALVAVRGPEGAGCREEGSGGTNAVGDEGGNSWEEGEGANMSYLVLEEEPWVMGEAIDDLLCQPTQKSQMQK